MTQKQQPPPGDSTMPSQDGESQYRRLVEMSPDIVLLCDEAGRILYVNLAGVEMLGGDEPQALVGRSLADIVHTDSLAPVMARLSELMEEMRELPFVEERFRRLDNTPFYAEMMAFPFFHQGAHVAHLVIRDSTRRKLAEAQQKRLKLRLLGTLAFVSLLLLSVGGYSTYQYTESTQFCGIFCHSVMSPRYLQHKSSPHSHVSCAGCHIGVGAAWYVKAKLSGFHQIYSTMTRSYANPIATPLENLRPAVETCEDCHSPEVFHGNRTRITRRVPDDGNADDPEITAVNLHVGGNVNRERPFVGIHWHADPKVKVEYQASDRKRLQIAKVRITRENGAQTLFTSQKIPTPASGLPWRVMDCCDCHNRVAHRRQSPTQAMDSLLLSGDFKSPLPEVKTASLAAIQGKYKTLPSARAGILKSLEQYYADRHPDLSVPDRQLIPALAEQ
ncbi:MAG: PAS domain-containing protein, partial [bacterium]